MSVFTDAYAYIAGLELHGYVWLGSGVYSTVMGKPGSDRVIKVNRNPDGWLDYVMWAARTGHAGKYAPRVYSYRIHAGFYVAVMERMAIGANGLRSANLCDPGPQYERYRAHENYIFHKQGWTWAQSVSVTDLPPDYPEFVASLLANFTALDLHAGNAMFRADGSLCWTDPISGGGISPTAPRRMRTRDLSPLPLAA